MSLPATDAVLPPICDLLVVGSGAAAFTAAITARLLGLDVLMVEKDPLFGGATARSGGGLWIPCNPVAARNGLPDSREAAWTYLQDQAGAYFEPARVEAFLDQGPAMIAFLEARAPVLQFILWPNFPDYHSDAPGGAKNGRSILMAPFDGRLLGREIRRMRPPLAVGTFLGMMVALPDAAHFFRAGRSLRSLAEVARLAAHMAVDKVLHGRTMRLLAGNGLIGRLAATSFGLGIPLLTSAPARELVMAGGAVTGAVVETKAGRRQITARRGVVLATGGFPHDPERRAQLYPEGRRGGEFWSLMPAANTGDGLRLGESAGGRVDDSLAYTIALTPVAGLPDGSPGPAFPVFAGRGMPGVIAVTRNGRRFVNESNSYHDFGKGLIAACRDEAEPAGFVLCDHSALRRYGLGYVKPFPLPIGPHLRSGHLLRGGSWSELAASAGIDPAALETTVAEYNRFARRGADPAFGRGGSVYNRALGDPSHQPNPCVGPLEVAPFYAIKVVAGSVGTFAGLATDGEARVLAADGASIPGLYAVGNDMKSVFGGEYVGGGTTLGPAMTFGYVAGRHAAAGQ